MIRTFFVLLLFPILLSAQQPDTVFISLPSCISAIRENPEKARKLFATLSFPQNDLLVRQEIEIRRLAKESKASNAVNCLKRREMQFLEAKATWLYSQANTDLKIGKVLLRLLDLNENLPFRADDDLFDLLQTSIWKGDVKLRAQALRLRPENALDENGAIRHRIAIQFETANALFDRVAHEPGKRNLPLIELLLVAAEPFPSLDDDATQTEQYQPPVLIPSPFPILDLYLHIFRLTDWSAY